MRDFSPATPPKRSAAGACDSLNTLMQLGPRVSSALRRALFRRHGCKARRTQPLLKKCLVPQNEAEFSLPAHIGDFTDFYISIHHATAIGRLFRPDNPLLPNYKWIPIGYHGRSSSIGVSGQSFPRPQGQRSAGGGNPTVGPSTRLDYELEMGVFIGSGNALGYAHPNGRCGESHLRPVPAQ